MLLLLLGTMRESSGGTGKVPPLFSFEEDGDTISFWSPKTVRIVRRSDGGAKVCQNELPDKGNMWSGSDVEQAFRNPDVQSSLRATKAPYSTEHAARLTVGDAAVTWVTACNKCLEQSAGIKHLYTVLHTVMRNQRLLCP